MSARYLNAASHGLPDRAVMRRMIAHLDLEAMLGTGAAEAQVVEELEAVHCDAAMLLGGAPEHVGFGTGTLSAWRAYVSGLPLTGKRLLVAPHEWGENIAILKGLADHAGARIEALPALDLANPDLSPWHDRMGEDVAALFLPMVSSVAGLRYPVEAIGALPRPDGMQVIVDAAQALGQVEVDAPRLGCDALFATTRKWMRGPRETAIFWTADPSHCAAIQRAHYNIALRLGLGVALRQIVERGIAKTGEALRERSERIRHRAAELDLACLSTPTTGTTAVTLAIPNDKAAAVASELEAADFVVRWPNPAVDEPLSGFDGSRAKPLRLAAHLTTGPNEIDEAFETIAAAL